ncbi:MAG: hypothetical protein P4L52_06555, partial [Acidocella sp.]|nr:hypothetical protein [Acidocella sp.]
LASELSPRSKANQSNRRTVQFQVQTPSVEAASIEIDKIRQPGEAQKTELCGKKIISRLK